MGRILHKGNIPTDSGRNDAPREKNAVKCNACHSIIAYNSDDLKEHRFGYNCVSFVSYLDCPVCKREIYLNGQSEVYDIPPAYATKEHSGKSKCFSCKAKFKYEPSDVLMREEGDFTVEYVLCPQCQTLTKVKRTVTPPRFDFDD